MPQGANNVWKQFIPKDIRAIGLTLLERVAIVDPAEYLDFILPASFASFVLQCEGFIASAQNNISYVLSADGGVTFYADATNFDAVHNTVNAISTAADGSAVVQQVAFADAVGYATDRDVTGAQNATLQISPGDATTFFRVLSQFETIGEHGGVWDHETGQEGGTVWPSATLTFVAARCDLIRVLPYGNGDFNPPTSGITYTAGTAVLWGVDA